MASDHLPHAADAITCPRCGARLDFEAVFVGHDGIYRCPNGDFERPHPELEASEIRLEGLQKVALSVGGTELQLPLGGLYNAYNLLAAYAVGSALGLDAGYMAARLRTVEAAFGRLERFEARGQRPKLRPDRRPAGRP